jgi:hypothetical protein
MTTIITGTNGFADPTDATKEVAFDVSAVATGSIRTVSVPNASLTMAGTNIAQAFTAPQTPDRVAGTVTATGSYAFDGSDQIRDLTLTNAATITFSAPSGLVAGTYYTFILRAGDTSARTFAWNAAWKFPSAVPQLTSGSTTSGAVDIITFIALSATTAAYVGHTADCR